ncbi:hypothetical protein QTI33_31890 [Variovorax sp. J22P271]|uniref:hypothetical protein n=1 Tax=Variovorax davisae TaxID=3053515 RepID=UPI0025761FD3|nr:hypothetical protein [Variovorax sp. J22P271]MDM0036775.1 hypothetical protein [Variovorax sp. J22P271]
MMLFCRFDNGKQTGLDAADIDELIGYVKGLDAAARCLGAMVWVAGSLPAEAGIDNDSWLTPENWLEANT